MKLAEMATTINPVLKQFSAERSEHSGEAPEECSSPGDSAPQSREFVTADSQDREPARDAVIPIGDPYTFAYSSNVDDSTVSPPPVASKHVFADTTQTCIVRPPSPPTNTTGRSVPRVNYLGQVSAEPPTPTPCQAGAGTDARNTSILESVLESQEELSIASSLSTSVSQIYSPRPTSDIHKTAGTSALPGLTKYRIRDIETVYSEPLQIGDERVESGNEKESAPVPRAVDDPTVGTE